MGRLLLLTTVLAACNPYIDREEGLLEDPADLADADNIDNDENPYKLDDGDVHTTGEVYGNRYDAWDVDDDFRLSPDEFTDGFVSYGWFEGWDDDEDGRLTLDEYVDGMLTLWDDDGDDVLTVWELKRDLDFWVRDQDVSMATIEVWDRNDDGVVDRDELHESLEPVFTRWDADGDDRLEQSELSVSVHKAWDTDEDGYVDVYESGWY